MPGVMDAQPAAQRTQDRLLTVKESAAKYAVHERTFMRWADSGIVPRGVAITWANEAADCRRQRRALTEDELVRLLDVAARRPLLDAQTIRTGKRRGEAVAKIRPEVEKRLIALGRERALIYKTLALTGLRRNELASLTEGQLRLEGERAFAELSAASEKSREGNAIPIRADLAADLGGWLRALRSRPCGIPTSNSQ